MCRHLRWFPIFMRSDLVCPSTNSRKLQQSLLYTHQWDRVGGATLKQHLAESIYRYFFMAHRFLILWRSSLNILFINRKVRPSGHHPSQVMARGAKTFTIHVGQRQEIISVDRLKAHTGSSPMSLAEAASCGRLPRSRPLLRSSLRHLQAAACVYSGGCGGGGLWRTSLNIYLFIVVFYCGAMQ